MDYRTNSIDHSSEIFLGPESESLEKLIDSGGTTFCVPVVKPSSCSWCGQLICTVRFFSGRWVFAEGSHRTRRRFLSQLAARSPLQTHGTLGTPALRDPRRSVGRLGVGMTLATIRADVAEVLRTLVLSIATRTVVESCGVREQERARFPVTTMTLALWPRGDRTQRHCAGRLRHPESGPPYLLARRVNHTDDYANDTTTDADILSRWWLPLDFDPVRPAGVSSTHAEHDAALARTRECRTYLTGQGLPDPVLGDSGNVVTCYTGLTCPITKRAKC